MPEIRPATIDNWNDLIKLKVREDQKGFVATNLYSIAEAQFGYDLEGHWDLHPSGIYEGDTPVGFFMYGFNKVHPRFQAFIFRLMVDENYQGKGYGRFGMEKMLEIFRARGDVQQVAISYKPENEPARKLYASFGFVEPGEMLEDEVLAIMKLR
jgi:diamine N-acetyltransferase